MGRNPLIGASMTKTFDTLVEDIYSLMKTKNTAKWVDTEAEIDKFGEAMKDLMRKEFMPGEGKWASRSGLRLSSIGKPDLIQWFTSRRYTGEKIQPNVLIKFMYGHLIEEMLLLFTRLSGHTVTDEQKECKVGGVTGHMDCKIDGLTVDVKSTTKFGILKFRDGNMAEKDDFGYVDQLKAYAHSEGERKFGWLAMDRDSGNLATLVYDLDDEDHPMHKFYSGDIEERIEHVKKSLESEDRPSLCASPEEDGKSGNLKLSTICSYCKFKLHCWPNVRGFYTGSGPKFLTTVVKVPRNRKGIPCPEINLKKGEVNYDRI